MFFTEEAKKMKFFRNFKDVEKTNIFKCKPPEVHFTIRNRVPYNKLLTNLACSSRTGEYWPSVVFLRISLCSVRTATTSGQYSPVRPLRSVSKRLILRNTGRMSENVCSYRSHVHASGGPGAHRDGTIRTTERTKPFQKFRLFRKFSSGKNQKPFTSRPEFSEFLGKWKTRPDSKQKITIKSHNLSH